MVKSAGARPTRPRTMAGMMSSSASALRKTTPTKTTSSKGAAATSQPISGTSGLKAPTSIPRATSPGILTIHDAGMDVQLQEVGTLPTLQCCIQKILKKMGGLGDGAIARVSNHKASSHHF